MAKYTRYDPRNKKKDKQRSAHLERTPIKHRNRGKEVNAQSIDDYLIDRNQRDDSTFL